MYTDLSLRLATAEAVPNAGVAPGGIGEDLSANPFLPHGGIADFLDNAGGLGGDNNALALNFDITTAYTASAFAATLEFQMVSLPIAASLLDDGSGGATDGKLLSIALVALTIATDTLTIVGHGLPLGAPIYLTTIAGGTTGVSANTIYYVVPETADTFKLAATQADALAGTTIALAAFNGTATVNFCPVVHASSGSLGIYGTNGVLSSTDHGIQVRFNPLRHGPGKSIKPTINATTPGTENDLPFGAGPGASIIAGAAHRNYYLRYIPAGGTITAGAVTVDLIYAGINAPQYHASGYKVI